MKKISLLLSSFIALFFVQAQIVNKTMLRLPDTGQTMSYTSSWGEDADFSINTPFFTIHANGTVTDTVTSLMWQRGDGGEMTIEAAIRYCDTLTLGGYTDWRLPNAHEAFSILNQQHTNPSLDPVVFPVDTSEYWWTSTRQANDTSKVWVTNAGGGIGNHPKTETVSAGGPKHFHVRAVRDVITPSSLFAHFTDLGDGSVRDNLSDLIWQRFAFSDSLTWEQSLAYADTLTLGGYPNWRLPNIKELQSINDESRVNPSVDTTFFNRIGITRYWSSTTLPNQTSKAWFLDTHFGITTYDAKTAKHLVMCVRADTLIATSVRDINNKSIDILLFPNPSSDILCIQFASSIDQDLSISLTDMQGKNLLNAVLVQGSRSVELSVKNIPSGSYYVKLNNELFERVVRIMVSH